MLDNQTLEQLRRLRLSGMAAAFAQQLEQPELQALSFEERFSLLLDRQLNLRENRIGCTIARRMRYWTNLRKRLSMVHARSSSKVPSLGLAHH